MTVVFVRDWLVVFVFFFFQAEDGIRDIGVTGVQTCALPICIQVVMVIAISNPIIQGVMLYLFEDLRNFLFSDDQNRKKKEKPTQFKTGLPQATQ